jgi:hypothetical protein
MKEARIKPVSLFIGYSILSFLITVYFEWPRQDEKINSWDELGRTYTCWVSLLVLTILYFIGVTIAAQNGFIHFIFRTILFIVLEIFLIFFLENFIFIVGDCFGFMLVTLCITYWVTAMDNGFSSSKDL